MTQPKIANDLRIKFYAHPIRALIEVRDFYDYGGEKVTKDVRIIGEYKRGHRLWDGQWSRTPASDGSSIPQKFLVIRVDACLRTMNLPKESIRVVEIFEQQRGAI